MINQLLTLGYSPCPNDTFMFHALVHQLIDTSDFNFDVKMEDVETLNQWASQGRLDITKLSFNAYLKLTDIYQLLHAGSALGRGVGPLLISLPGFDEKKILNGDAVIAIPGINTTANFLCSTFFPHAQTKVLKLFSQIENAVLSGEVDAGVIIHESRFTYLHRGLHKICDLGERWEKSTLLPIPLGGIVIKKSFSNEIKNKINSLVKQSILFGYQFPNLSKEYIKQHAQEINDNVIAQHIELYVNKFSIDLGDEGKAAVAMFFKKAYDRNVISEIPTDIYV